VSQLRRCPPRDPSRTKGHTTGRLDKAIPGGVAF